MLGRVNACDNIRTYSIGHNYLAGRSQWVSGRYGRG